MRPADARLPRIPRRDDTSNAMKSYFRSPPIGLAILFLLFAICLLPISMLGFLSSLITPIAWPLKIFFLLVPLIWSLGPLLIAAAILRSSERKKSSQELDSWFDSQLEHDLRHIEARAIQKIQMSAPGFMSALENALDVAVKPPERTYSGVALPNEAWGDFKDAIPAWRNGLDGETRYLIYQVSVLLMAEHHMAQYRCTYNMETGLILSEGTTDCNYKDITTIDFEEHRLRATNMPSWWTRLSKPLSVLSISQLILHFIKLLMPNSVAVEADFSVRTLRIYLGGEHLRIPLSTSEATKDLQTDSQPDPLLSGVRFLLREKRMSYVRTITA